MVKLSVRHVSGQDAHALIRYFHHHLEIVGSKRDDVWKRLQRLRKGELVSREHVLVSMGGFQLRHGCV